MLLGYLSRVIGPQHLDTGLLAPSLRQPAAGRGGDDGQSDQPASQHASSLRSSASASSISAGVMSDIGSQCRRRISAHRTSGV